MNELDNDSSEELQNEVEIDSTQMYGIINIDKLGMQYPIIKYETEASLKKSICKLSTNNIDGTGNLCLIGHNMRNKRFFSKLNNMKVGDEVKLTNMLGNVYIYIVTEMYYIDPDDVSVLENTDEAILTLITCNRDSSERLVVRAELINGGN